MPKFNPRTLVQNMPWLEDEQTKFQIEEAERKKKKLILDYLKKQADQAAQQQQIQAARNSV